MNETVITFDPYSRKSIDKAIEKLNDYKASIDPKMQRVMKRLQDYGIKELNVLWNMAVYDGIDATQTSYKMLENGFEIIASGEQVLFVEFGAGVYYNPGGNRNYRGEEPPGLIPIGEYGQKHGRKEGWFFKGAEGNQYTHGNPANACVWDTGIAMAQEVLNILREEFAR